MPGLGQGLNPGQAFMAAHQRDQHLTAVMADPQSQVAKAAAATEIHIHRPVRVLQIGLDIGNQAVDPRIEHWTTAHVDDPVAAAAVIPSPQRTIDAALQGDQGTVAIAQCRWRTPDRVNNKVQLTDAA